MSLAAHLEASFRLIEFRSPCLIFSKSSIIYLRSRSSRSLLLWRRAICSPLYLAISISLFLGFSIFCSISTLSLTLCLSSLSLLCLSSFCHSIPLISSMTSSSLYLSASLSAASLSNSLLLSLSIAVTLVYSISSRALSICAFSAFAL